MSQRSLPRPRITRPWLRCRSRAGIHQPAHLADRGLEADEDRLADQEVADIEFAHLGDGGDRRRRLVVQAVAGVAFEAELLPQSAAAFCDARKLGVALRRPRCSQ